MSEKQPALIAYYSVNPLMVNQTTVYLQPGKPNQNAFVERFNRSFRDEVLNAKLFNSVDQAQEAADDWVQD